MFAKKSNPMDAWIAQSTKTFEFWASLWPTAPLFGVKWRFAEPFKDLAPPFRLDAGYLTVRDSVWAGPSAAKFKDTTVDAVAVEVSDGEAKVESAAPTVPVKDDLTRLKGIGPGLERQLNALGVISVAQLAALSEAELAEIDAQLTGFNGRCFRDDWVGQAKALIG